MTLTKAIELLKHPAPLVGSVGFHDYFKATRLGIEALERVEKLHESPFFSSKPLPGETKD